MKKAKFPISNVPATVATFAEIAGLLQVRDPSERFRILACLLCLFDPEVAEWIVERWRGN